LSVNNKQNFKSVAITIFDLFAFNTQKSRRHVTLAMLRSLVKKQALHPDCSWEHACQIWSSIDRWATHRNIDSHRTKTASQPLALYTWR